MYRKSMREALQEARAYRDPLQEDKGFSSQQIKMAYGVLNDPRYKQGNYSGAVKAIEKIAKGLSNHPDVANALKRANEELEEAKTAGGALAQGHLETMTDQRFKEFYGITKDEYIKKYGDPRKEELDEALEVKWDSNKQGWFDKQGRRRYLGKMATNKLMSKAIDKAKETGDFINPFKLQHGQKPEEVNTDTYADSKKKMLNKEETELVEFTLADYRELESDNQHDIAAKKLIDKFGTPQEKSTINDINRRHAKTGYISGTDFRLRTMIVNRYYSRLK